MDRPELRLIRSGGLTWGQVPAFVEDVRRLEAAHHGIRADLVAMIRRLEASGIGGDERTSDLVSYPVATHPDVGELRLNVRRHLFRIYLTAPSRTPPDVVGLLFAHKDVSGPETGIRSAQNADIALAAHRAVDAQLWT